MTQKDPYLRQLPQHTKSINNSLFQGVDFDLLTQKHTALLDHHAKELSSVLRYMFYGYVTPSAIEDATIVLRRNLHNLIPGEGLKTRNDQEVVVLSVDQQKDTTYVTFSVDRQPEQTIGFSLVNDPTWGNYPTTQIAHNDHVYRSVPYHGDVRNHLFHQHERYGEEYLKPLVISGLIDPLDAHLIHLFHQIHDLPETVKGDKHVNDKSTDDSDQESEIIIDLIQQAKDVHYTTAEKTLTSHGFSIYEHPQHLFKGGERLNYLADVFRIYSCAENYLADRDSFIMNVLSSQLPLFAQPENPKSQLIVTPLTGKSFTLPLQKLASNQLFFAKWKDTINNLLTTYPDPDLLIYWKNIVTYYEL